MKKLVLGIVFGVDARNGLIWFVALTLAFWLFGWNLPHGWERLIAVAVAGLAAILPDLDMLPYMLLRKDKIAKLWVLGIGGFVFFGALAVWLTAFSFAWLGFVWGIVVAFVGMRVYGKVVDRASHWPIWHHPIPVVVIAFGLTWLFAADFAPAHLWYYELLVVPLVIAHFLHDGLQPQGFPFFSPFSDTHYRLHLQVLRFEEISDAQKCLHYEKQFAKAREQSTLKDAERRADVVTRRSVIHLALAGAAVLAILLFL